MKFTEFIDDLKTQGFEGFVPVYDLKKSTDVVPEKEGIYLVLRLENDEPEFLIENPGGHYNKKNPTEDIAVLRNRWIPGCHILYVGETVDLKERITTLMKYANGEPERHWGGRYMWQIKGSENHLICWRLTDKHEAAKKEFIKTFKAHHNNKKTFANIK